MRRLALVLLLVVAGCSTDDRGSATLRATEPPASVTAAPTTRAPSPSPTDPLGDEPVQFSTPTHNIGCYISRRFAQCDISKKSWTPPPKPANCELDWGNGLVVRAAGKAELVCASDSVLGSSKTVQYGGAVRVGDLQCVVSQKQVECFSDTTNHGFTLSRTHYTLT